MKASIEVKLQAFRVPNYVICVPDCSGEDGYEPPDKSFSLESVDAIALDRLCNQFRDDVFKKAKKKDPRLES